MAAIITDQLRILNAKNFVSLASSDKNSYYAFVGLPNATEYSSDWDVNPASPKDSFDDEKDPKSNKDAVKEHRGDPIQLPDSTHTLFFTSNILSLPGFFAIGVAALSVGCLALALINALEGGSSRNPLNVPENVTSATRGAKYLSIFVALLREEGKCTSITLLDSSTKVCRVLTHHPSDHSTTT